MEEGNTMRKSFAKNESPLLIGVVREKTIRGALAMIRNCEYHGATALDLHLSCLDEDARTVESLSRIVEATRLPILGLNYCQTYDMQPAPMDEETRLGLLWRFIEAGGAAVDMQGYSFDAPSKQAFRTEFSHLPHSFVSCQPKEVVMDEAIIEKQMAFIDRVHAAGGEVLLSTHTGVPMTCEQVVDMAKFLEKRGPDVLKIVTPCPDEEHLGVIIQSMIALKKAVSIPVHLHGNGKAGMLSRLINPLLGGYLIFCCDGYTESSNYEQLDLQTARRALDDLRKMM